MRGLCAGMFRGLLRIYLICILHAKIVYTSKAAQWELAEWYGRGRYAGWLALFSRLHYSYATCAKLLAWPRSTRHTQPQVSLACVCVCINLYLCACGCVCALPGGCINCMFNWPTINDLMNTADTLKHFKQERRNNCEPTQKETPPPTPLVPLYFQLMCST